MSNNQEDELVPMLNSEQVKPSEEVHIDEVQEKQKPEDSNGDSLSQPNQINDDGPHSTPNFSTTPNRLDIPCKYGDKCWYGNDCRFTHLNEEEMKLLPPQPKVACIYFQRGFCAMGVQCQFLHESTNETPSPSDNSSSLDSREPRNSNAEKVEFPKPQNISKQSPTKKKKKERTPQRDHLESPSLQQPVTSPMRALSPPSSRKVRYEYRPKSRGEGDEIDPSDLQVPFYPEDFSPISPALTPNKEIFKQDNSPPNVKEGTKSEPGTRDIRVLHADFEQGDDTLDFRSTVKFMKDSEMIALSFFDFQIANLIYESHCMDELGLIVGAVNPGDYTTWLISTTHLVRVWLKRKSVEAPPVLVSPTTVRKTTPKRKEKKTPKIRE